VIGISFNGSAFDEWNKKRSKIPRRKILFHWSMFVNRSMIAFVSETQQNDFGLWSCHSPNHNDSTKRLFQQCFPYSFNCILQWNRWKFHLIRHVTVTNNPPTEGLPGSMIEWCLIATPDVFVDNIPQIRLFQTQPVYWLVLIFRHPIKFLRRDNFLI
jgi:hypothetical protein